MIERWWWLVGNRTQTRTREEKTMNPRRMHGLAIVILMALPAVARAQSDSDDITAQVTLVEAINVIGTTDLNFGTVLVGSTLVRSSEIPTAGTWTAQDIPSGLGQGNGVRISFSLPGTLDNAGATQSVIITYGQNSAALDDGINPPFTFDPAAGILFPIGAAPTSFTITLGEDLPQDTTGDVEINVLGAPADTYTGVITMTVAIQ
jgi:hypothetical protein